MKNQIRIYYETGDSFSLERREDILELTWENIDIAKENLQAIKENYEMNKEFSNIRWNSPKNIHESIHDKYKDKWWYVEQYPKVSIFLKTDDNKLIQIGTYWTGYFETLLSAEVISNDETLKFYAY